MTFFELKLKFVEKQMKIYYYNLFCWFVYSKYLSIFIWFIIGYKESILSIRFLKGAKMIGFRSIKLNIGEWT